MKRFAIVFILLFWVTSVTAQSPDRFQSLFSDFKAHKVGDILTIYIVEFSSGTNSSSSNTTNENKMSVSTSRSGTLDFFPIFGIGTSHGNEFKGDGEVSQRGQLRAKLSAQIIDVNESGNIKIQGKKIVEINGEKQTTILTGWVRPEDITSNNVVYSYNIADAEIQYMGKGVSSAAAKPGWLTKILNWIF